jgi:hypothetical protein
MAKSKKPKTPKPAKKPIAYAPPAKLTDAQLDELMKVLGAKVPPKKSPAPPPPVDYDQFTPVEPLVTEANLAKLGIPATDENIKTLMNIAGDTYISDVDDFQHVLENFYPKTLAAMKAKASLTAPPPSLVGKAPPPIVDDPWAEDATFIPAKEKPAKEPSSKPKSKGAKFLPGTTQAELDWEPSEDKIAQAKSNAVDKAKALHDGITEDIFQELTEGDKSIGPGEFLRRLKDAKNRAIVTEKQASALATRADSWATDLIRKKQQDSVAKYADFLTANGVHPDTVQRVMSGELDISPRARAERALQMGLDPGMVWQRVDEPLKNRFQGRARAGLTYAGFNEALARAAAMTGSSSKRYPLIGSPKLLGVRAADTPLKPITDRMDAIQRIWAQLPQMEDGTGNRIVRTSSGQKAFFESPEQILDYMTQNAGADYNIKNVLQNEVAELMSDTTYASRVDDLVREYGPAVRRYLQSQADSVVGTSGEARRKIFLPKTAQAANRSEHVRTLHPPHWTKVEFENHLEPRGSNADMRQPLNTRRVQAFRQYLRDAGLEGLLVDDEAGVSVAFDQPDRLRHAEVAALDPEFADEPNIYQSVMPIMAAATGGQMASQIDRYDGSQVPPGEIPEWLMATPSEEQEQEQQQFQGFPPMQPNEGFGEYLIRTGQAQRATPYKRRAVDNRTSIDKMVGDFNTDITNQELEDWYVSLDENPSPEHEQFKQSLAATLDEPVFTGTPKEEMPYQGGVISTDADGYEPMTFNQWFLNNIQPLVWNKTGVDYDAVDNMKEQVLAKLMGEPYDFDDPDVELYTTMALNNLRDGQMADEFPAMSESEAAEAQQKYGDNARFYIGRDNQENFARRRAYALAQTFANGEHAPPGQGIAPAALATAGQTINTAGDWIASAARSVNGMLGLPGPSPQNSDGSDGYADARLAVDALSGIRGRLRSANEWNQRALENPELAFDSVTGAKYATESGTNPSGLSNKMGKSDGYYQYAANALKSMWGNPSRTAEERDALWQHERENNRTTPIVPDSVMQDPEQYDNRAEAATLFEDYKQGTDDWAAAMHSRLLGVPPTQFLKDVYDVPREIMSDPIELASTIGSGGLGLLTKGLKSGLKSAAMGFIRGFPREGAEEVTENSGINSLLGNPYDYFLTPVTDNALTGDVDPRDANAYKSALEAGLLEQESKLKRATNLMRPK